MKGYKKTLALFIILILFSGFYFYLTKTEPKRIKKKQESKKIFIGEKDKINSIFIKDKEKEIEILKSDNFWIIKEKNYECDRNEIESLINKILSLEMERNLGEVEDLKQYGLEKPEKLLMICEDNQKLFLFVGDETPSGSYLYASTDKREVFLISKWDLKEIFEKNIFDLRDKRIIPAEITKSDIEEIEVKKAKTGFHFTKKDEIWNIDYPINDWADKDKIENFIEKIVNGKVQSFEEEKSEKECGLEKPEVLISLKTKENKYFLHFGKKVNDSYYCKNSLKPYIFKVEKNLLEDISENINDLRYKKLFEFSVSDVAEFSITKNGKELKIVKIKEDYFFEKDRKKRISKEKVEEFLEDLKNLEIENFLEYSEKNLNNYSLSTPPLKISVFDGRKKTEIYFGKKVDKEIYCYHPKRKIIFTISSDNYPKIDKDENFFLKTKKNE
ncbi:MAG: DUF4340 domain-containing protein [Candidatus Omnitrophica bacterium]|nr:DUF4340 domain-containing protein [Candidatus Omnitrophota bacterium]MCM8807431.1 DUF4340 domain-containing protein [Candidatus Omnitrophota bacterium]